MTTDANPWDGTAVNVVPSAVERLPLWHWRPGARVLAVGSRDGAVFADWRAAEERTFHRPLDVAVLRAMRAKTGVAGLAATFSESLAFPRSLAAVADAAEGETLLVATAGRGDAELLDRLLPRVDAWSLLIAGEPGPLAARILAAGRHVEILLGLDGGPLPALDWACAAAVHLVPRRPAADPGERRAWAAAARAAIAGTALYDEDHPHSDCACGARLIWRSGAASRRDALDPGAACTACGARARFVLC